MSLFNPSLRHTGVVVVEWCLTHSEGDWEGDLVPEEPILPEGTYVYAFYFISDIEKSNSDVIDGLMTVLPYST